ncbi:hypothetical protein OF83DRAFT_1079999 [Amylostereum chailletii]|nr:hypothetical protein OF83DRAFT_1079999 [Amylostereum chailletii]
MFGGARCSQIQSNADDRASSKRWYWPMGDRGVRECQGERFENGCQRECAEWAWEFNKLNGCFASSASAGRRGGNSLSNVNIAMLKYMPHRSIVIVTDHEISEKGGQPPIRLTDERKRMELAKREKMAGQILGQTETLEHTDSVVATVVRGCVAELAIIGVSALAEAEKCNCWIASSSPNVSPGPALSWSTRHLESWQVTANKGQPAGTT